MDNSQNQSEDFLKYYKQTKQRVDIDIDLEKTSIIGLTKLTFIPKEINNIQNQDYILKLNAENIYIKSVYIIKKDEDIVNLTFKNTNPYYTKSYLEDLYQNIEEIESFRNVNRVEWEIRNAGNIIIKIPLKSLNDSNKIKLKIEYELMENNIGIVFQSFYEERIDTEHKICYTPNFYCNTSNWVPCIYDLKVQVYWRLYLFIPNDYMGYSSCKMIKIVQGKNNKKLIVNYSLEPITARNIGFIVLNEKIFTRISDNCNKSFLIVANENKKERIEKNLISNKLISTLYNFYDEFFDINETSTKSNLYIPTLIVFIPYLSFNTTNLNFKKFIKGKDENYFNIIKFPSLYIIPEKYLYNPQIPEMMKIQLRALSKIFITNYIGGLITESTFADFWLISGLESWLSNLFIGKAYGNSYIKGKVYKLILKFKKICKEGKEIHPLYTNNFSHPMELQLDNVSYLKSQIIFHLLEAQIEKIFVQKALKNIINERTIKGYNLSTEGLIKIFKKNCGNNLKPFMNLYVYKTGMLEIELKYSYNQKTNSIDIEIHQDQIAKKYYDSNPFFKLKEIDYDTINKLNKNIDIIDFRTKANRYFDILFNLNIIQTNGIEIMRDPHKIKLENEKENYVQNFPLISKIRKMPLKKREQDFIQDLITNTSISKIYANEDIEKIFTQNSILWIRVDPELTSLRVNKIKQQHILYEYIKIFRDADIVGQMESLNNIGKDKENYHNSLSILKTLIESNTVYYKIRQYALEIYIKIILKLKNENEYQFLIDYLDDCYNDILKNKTSLNYDTYYVMKEIIKYLGEYREDYFTQFYVLGLVTNSQIQNKIINKFLSILVSNELNTITGFDDSYVMSEILIGCSRLNLQENSLILLKKILKNLRVEKLKRSFNEVTIISSLQAFLNLMIRNDFYSNKNEFKSIINEILSEINYYINSECENYELNVFLNYFQIYLIYYKSKSYIEFTDRIRHFVLGENFNNTSKSVKISIDFNLEIISKIRALSFLFNTIDFSFNEPNEKIILLKCLKDILFSPQCYQRIDCKMLMEKAYLTTFKKQISLLGAGNNNFANVNFMHILNNNWANYAGKKYADEDWLYSFIHEEKNNSNGEDDNYSNEDSNETHSQVNLINNTQMNLIRKYQNKYKDDNYAILNCEINTDSKSLNQVIDDIIEKLLNHPLSNPFSYELNRQSLGNFYNQYMKVIERPIDLNTIKNNIDNNYYQTFSSFNSDVLLMFSNCKTFNAKGSELYNSGIQLEEYYKLMIAPIKRLKLSNNFNTSISIKVNLDNMDIDDRNENNINSIHNNNSNIIGIDIDSN